ncbi:MAG: prolyl oligopeptidase, partial [Luteibaculaceae bacterium]
MKKMNKAVTAAILIPAMMACNASKEEKFSYPETQKRDSIETYFGLAMQDPYQWLEDDYAPEVVQWVKEQNAFASKYLNSLPEKDAIKNRLSEIWNYERLSTPFKHNKKTYYFKNDGVQNQSVLFESIEGGDDQVILDPNTFSVDGTSSLSGMSFSKSGKYLAYGVSEAGSDWKSILVKNMETGELLEDEVNWVKFSGISWQGDGFFYSRYSVPEEGDEFSQKNEFHKVFFHSIGTDQKKDVLIWEDEEHAQRNFYASTTEEEDLVIIGGSEGTSGNALWVKQPGKDIVNIVP